MKKKLIAIVLVLTFAVVLAGCGSEPADSDKTSSSNESGSNNSVTETDSTSSDKSDDSENEQPNDDNINPDKPSESKPDDNKVISINQRPDGYLEVNNSVLKPYRDPTQWDKYEPSMANDQNSMFPMGDPRVLWAIMTANVTWQGVSESYTYKDYIADKEAESIDYDLNFDISANELNQDYDVSDGDAFLDAYEIEYSLNINGKNYSGTVPAKSLSEPASPDYDYEVITSSGARIIWTMYENPIHIFGPYSDAKYVIALHLEDGDYVTDRFLAKYY